MTTTERLARYQNPIDDTRYCNFCTHPETLRYTRFPPPLPLSLTASNYASHPAAATPVQTTVLEGTAKPSHPVPAHLPPTTT